MFNLCVWCLNSLSDFERSGGYNAIDFADLGFSEKASGISDFMENFYVFQKIFVVFNFSPSSQDSTVSFAFPAASPALATNPSTIVTKPTYVKVQITLWDIKVRVRVTMGLKIIGTNQFVQSAQVSRVGHFGCFVETDKTLEFDLPQAV